MNTAPHFKVHTFEGPLDLLLQLIEEKKLPITKIAITEVTEQFLQHLKTLEKIRPEILADFLVVAAKLLVIKSRSLLPSLEVGEEENVGADLTNQLLLLKQYREAGKYLKELDNRRRQSFAREAFAGQAVFFFPDPSINMSLLRKAAGKLSAELGKLAKLPELAVAEVVSISEKIELLQKQITEKATIALSELVKKSKSKTDVIVTFLAILELIKQKILSVEQEGLFSDIIIRRH